MISWHLITAIFVVLTSTWIAWTVGRFTPAWTWPNVTERKVIRQRHVELFGLILYSLGMGFSVFDALTVQDIVVSALYSFSAGMYASAAWTMVLHIRGANRWLKYAGGELE
jgi:hypothetical protein